MSQKSIDKGQSTLIISLPSLKIHLTYNYIGSESERNTKLSLIVLQSTSKSIFHTSKFQKL